MRRLPLLFLLLALTIVGCGGSGGDAGSDPAELAPPGAPFYAEAVVRPEGEQREELEALASKLLRTDDPAGKIHELLDKVLSKEGSSYDEDIAPWLGRRVGVYAGAFEREEPQFGVIAATSDADAASDALSRMAKREGATAVSDGDLDYWFDADENVAYGVVGDMVVGASPKAEFKRAADAGDGESLADADRYKNAIGRLPDERVGHLFMDTRTLFTAATQAPGADRQALQLLEQIFPRDMPPSVVALLADEETIALESYSVVPENASALSGIYRLGGTGATPLVKELPGDSWAAFGIPKVGETAKEVYGLVAGALGGAIVEEQIRKETGLDLERDVFSWIGDTAGFVRGDTPDTVDGGAVIEVTDAAAARSAITRLVGVAIREGAPFERLELAGTDLAYALSGAAPKPIVIALAGDRAVITYGEPAAGAALKPTSQLGDSDLHEQARELLDGLEPSFLIDGQTAVQLIWHATDDLAEFNKIRPYLEPIGVIAAGSERDGENSRSRFAMRVK